MSQEVLEGNVRDVLKDCPDGFFHCAVTSPPYYGLRRYGTEDQTWGGDPNCEHDWNEYIKPCSNGIVTHEIKTQTISGSSGTRSPQKSNFCSKCGAWKGELGLEPTPEMYVQHLVEIFRELRRVLRDDGIFWCNIGDSFASNPGKGGSGTPTDKNNRGENYPRAGLGGCKPKDMIGIPWMLAFALRKDGWYLRSDLPWIKRNCLGSGTTVYTRSQKGVMPQTIHDLTHNNLKSTEVWNGKRWSRVVDLHQTEIVSDGVEFELRSGEKITCTKEHRWPTTRGLLQSFELKVGDVIEKTNLPDTDNLGPKYIPDTIGRIVGLFLAEGSYLTRSETEGICFTFSKKETHLDEEIKRFALEYGGSHHSHTYEGDGKLMSIIHGKVPMAIIMSYVSNKGSKHKRLSNACWLRNNEFLKQLLMGYLEGDGHNDIANRRWRLGFCENDKLAQDIRTLCARLGMSLRLKRGLVSAVKGGKMYSVWRGQIRFDQIDRSINDTCFKHAEDTEIMSISKAKSQHFYDIGVADDPHLFALSSGVLTHNSLPSSVTDRPSSSIEHVFLLAKSGETQFWTHPTLGGTRVKPEPDYVYTNALTREVVSVPPENWKTLYYTGDNLIADIADEDGEEVPVGRKKLWKRRNLWDGHDYYYDYVATMQPSSESYKKDKRPKGVLRQCVNANSKYPDEGQFKKQKVVFEEVADGIGAGITRQDVEDALRKQDALGKQTYTGFNDRYEDPGTGLRFMRDSDFFFRTWQGLLHNEDGEPMALVVNPKGYKGAHFAAFPPKLVEVMILAGTSEKGVCPECGAPWVRDITKTFVPQPDVKDPEKLAKGTGKGLDESNSWGDTPHGSNSFETTGWHPTCSHNLEPVPATVLDPFAGSCATGVACEWHNRDFIGIELKHEYCELGRKRMMENK